MEEKKITVRIPLTAYDITKSVTVATGGKFPETEAVKLSTAIADTDELTLDIKGMGEDWDGLMMALSLAVAAKLGENIEKKEHEN